MTVGFGFVFLEMDGDGQVAGTVWGEKSGKKKSINFL